MTAGKVWGAVAGIAVGLAVAGGAVSYVAHDRHLTLSDVLHVRTHHGPGIYPDEVRDRYTESCKAASGGSTTLCGCVYNKIAERYTLTEFERIELALPLGLPDEVREMYADCRTAS
jgi:hypothetical protein